jgi:hypothetical protein
MLKTAQKSGLDRLCIIILNIKQNYKASIVFAGLSRSEIKEHLSHCFLKVNVRRNVSILVISSMRLRAKAKQ